VSGVLTPREVFRASRLDEFLMYQAGEKWDGSEYTAEEFAARLRDTSESLKMSAGTAVHKSLELAQPGEIFTDQQNGWTIRYELDAAIYLPRLREVPLQRDHNGITLFGRCDSLTATSVHDIKTTSAIDPDRYAESYQWRAYLWMSGRPVFFYDIFKAKIDEETYTVTLTDYVCLRFHRYAAMDRDVERVIEEFAAAVDALGIFPAGEAIA
jgi:hypothetical protein